jgi:hypothetical protein
MTTKKRVWKNLKRHSPRLRRRAAAPRPQHDGAHADATLKGVLVVEGLPAVEGISRDGDRRRRGHAHVHQCRGCLKKPEDRRPRPRSQPPSARSRRPSIWTPSESEDWVRHSNEQWRQLHNQSKGGTQRMACRASSENGVRATITRPAYCGSVRFEDMLNAVENGYSVIPTDKRYKLYVMMPNSQPSEAQGRGDQ